MTRAPAKRVKPVNSMPPKEFPAFDALHEAAIDVLCRDSHEFSVRIKNCLEMRGYEIRPIKKARK